MTLQFFSIFAFDKGQGNPVKNRSCPRSRKLFDVFGVPMPLSTSGATGRLPKMQRAGRPAFIIVFEAFGGKAGGNYLFFPLFIPGCLRELGYNFCNV
jgi:hypothetical protein